MGNGDIQFTEFYGFTVGVGDTVGDTVGDGVGFGGSSGCAVGTGVGDGDGVAVGDGRFGGVGVCTPEYPLSPVGSEICARARPEITNTIASSNGIIFFDISFAY
jgi:hypothetical protein